MITTYQQRLEAMVESGASLTQSAGMVGPVPFCIGAGPDTGAPPCSAWMTGVGLGELGNPGHKVICLPFAYPKSKYLSSEIPAKS
jgi:hypothetical protein